MIVVMREGREDRKLRIVVARLLEYGFSILLV